MPPGLGRVNTIRPEFVELAPPNLLPGVLYISDRFKTAVHLCPCGCGEKVVTPLSPARWQLTLDGSAVSLHPSVGNWDYACRSHYIIRGNNILWAGALSAEGINEVQARDKRDMMRQVATRNALKKRSLGEWLRDILARIAKIFTRS